MGGIVAGIPILFLLICSCGQKPDSCFGFSQQERPGDLPLLFNQPVLFSNCSSEGESFYWDFGDGHSSQEKNPRHQYDAPGTFTVTLTTRFRDREARTARTLSLSLPSLADSLTGSWRLSKVSEYLLNNNYPIDSMEPYFSETIWQFALDGTLRISGFPMSATENWYLNGRNLYTGHHLYAVMEMTSQQLHLRSTDTLLHPQSLFPGILERHLWLESAR